MPNLTEPQIKFLSKYLKVVPKTGRFRSQSKHDKALEFNELVKLNFTVYEAKKKEADDLALLVKGMVAELKVLLGAVSERQGGEALKTFRADLIASEEEVTRLTQAISAEHVTVMNAPKGKPVFGQGVINLGQITGALKLAKIGLPTPPPLLNDGIVGALYSARAKIAPLRAFEDNGFLTVALTEATLPTQEADKTRNDARLAHILLCDASYNRFCDLIDPALNDESPLTGESVATECDRVMADLLKDRKVPIKAMIDVIKANAKGKIDTLATEGNEVALRENKRSEEIQRKLEKLERQFEALTDSVEKLRLAVAGATGFKEKQAAIKKYEDALQRMGSMKDYIDQLDAYDNDLALKVERITRAVNENQKGLALVADPDAYLLSEGVSLDPMLEKHVDDLLLGAPDKAGKHVNGVYDNLLDQFTRASKRVSIDVKLFPGEDDLTDISETQFNTLKAMIDAAKVVAESGQNLMKQADAAKKKKDRAELANQGGMAFAKASFMFDEAQKLYGVFNASNKFPLPAAPEPEVSDKDRIIKLLADGGVELDRFWGIGGDADEEVRNKLDAARASFKAEDVGPESEKYTETDKLIVTFQNALAAARKAFRPSPSDTKAREDAAQARDAVVDGLLKLYKTKERQEAEIGDIPADHLLVIERNGKKEYHEILTKGNGDEINRRDDKDIPRESINQLLEQATMLELLAQSEAPDMADAIAKAIEDSNKKLDGITKGGELYKNIKKYIAACEVLLAKSTLQKWIPKDLQAVKVNFETFKGEYPTKYLPLKGEDVIDKLYKKIQALIEESDQVRVAYTEADKIMVQVEKDFANAKGSAPVNLTTKLAEIIKAGPSGLAKGYTPTREEEQEVAELLAKMQRSLKEITDISTKASADGPLKPRVKSARVSLETKSADGIAKGRAEAEAIRDEMKAELDKLDPSNGLQYMKDLEAFLKGQATAATETKAELEKMAEIKLEVKTKLGEASDILKTKNKKTFKAYKEYKTIYDSLKTQYETAKKGYDKDKDAKNAVSEYKNILPNAKQLASDLGKLTVVWTPSQKAVDFGKYQTSLDTKIQSVRDAAIAASQKAIEEAADDEQAVIDATAKAAETLALAGTAEIATLVKLKGDLQQEADDALKITDEKDRIKALGVIREKALAEVRRIHSETEKHPALKIYRDNPFVKDVSWPAFAAALHELDVKVLTTLQPR